MWYRWAGERLRSEVGGATGASRDWLPRGCRAVGVESLGGGEGGSGLGGALLGLAKFGEGFGEGGELEDEDGGGAGVVAAEMGAGGHEAGGVPELVARWCGGGDAPVGLAGGAVVEVGRLAQRAAAKQGGGHVQGVGGGAGGVGGCGRAGGGGPDVGGGVGGGLGGVVEHSGAFRRLSAGCLSGGCRVPAGPGATVGLAWAR
jgi:hypothetical protein